MTVENGNPDDFSSEELRQIREDWERELQSQKGTGEQDWVNEEFKYRSFTSSSKGKGRSRRYPVDVELVGDGRGVYTDINRPRNQSRIEEMGIEAGIEEIEEFKKRLRRR